MRERGRYWIASLVLAAASGCLGKVDVEAAQQASAFRPTPVHLPPISPDVGWQFFQCFDDDHRAGFSAAVAELARQPPIAAAVLGDLVVDSRCIDGQERGGIFRGDAFGDRGAGLAQQSFRPQNTRFAFRIDGGFIEDVAAQLWAGTPRRFGEDGTPTANGRYELTGYSDTLGMRPLQVFRLVDTTNARGIDVMFNGPLLLTRPDPPQSAYEASIRWFEPSSSSIPAVQTVINVATKLDLRLWSGPARGAADAALWSLVFSAAPSLKGWAPELRFVDYRNDDDGTVFLYGPSDLIQ